MRALRLAGADGKPVLVEADLPRPVPRPGEVLVRVRAAGVTPTEIRWYPTSHTKNGGERTGAVLSHEFSGEVAEVGEGVSAFSAGNRIYGMNDWFADGALAEYCITQPGWIAPKPRVLDDAGAATVPIAALTAWQGFDRVKLERGESVLVHGGAGSVGMFAVQLAHLRGARIATTVSANNIEFVKSLGADQAIDYRTARFEDTVQTVDIVFDTVGGDTLRRSWTVLKRGGRLVTIAASGEGTGDERVKNAFFIVEPNAAQLIEVGRMLDAGDLRTEVAARVPFGRASDAYSGAIERKAYGKMVVVLD
jgi:NADPH:quinone reductase-like Zn-dependent oxidoreductase